MSIATGHDRFEARVQRRSLRRVGFAMVVLLAVAQIGALLHLSAVEHVLSPNTDALVHHRPDIPSSPIDSPAPDSHHETCEIFAFFQQASNVTLPIPTIGAPTVFVHDWPSVPASGVTGRAWPIYRLAPSNSPPDLAG